MTEEAVEAIMGILALLAIWVLLVGLGWWWYGLSPV